ncbi:MAG: SBBP repeat-containing protein [Candidatus Saccharicenans sp.]
MKSGKRRPENRKNLHLLSGLLLAAVAVFLGIIGFEIDRPLSPSFEKAGTRSVSLAGISLPFIQNKGQWDSQLQFRADLFSGGLGITERELIYTLVSVKAEDPGNVDEELPGVRRRPEFRSLIFREKFLSSEGKSLSFSPSGKEIVPTSIFFFQGDNSSARRLQLTAFRRLSLGQVYPGIEVELLASAGNVEKIFYVQPGADAGSIRIKIEGVDSLEVSKEGNLVLKTEAGRLEMVRPVAFQEIDGRRQSVEMAYELIGQNEYGFRINGDYLPEYPLVIDPALNTLDASTYLGGNGNDRGYCIAVNSEGKVYVAGYTFSILSSSFPTTEGVIDTTPNGGYDIFISRFDNDLKNLEASTYLGGQGDDYVYSLTLAADGSVYIAGITASRNFPVTSGALQTQYQGGEYDVFVTRLSPGLDQLLASTYLGGSGVDYAAGLSLVPATIADDTVVAVGMTGSDNFPLTPGTWGTTLRGGHDAFVAVLSNNLSHLQAATLIGGSNYDIAAAVAVDHSGYIWLAGRTKSSDFPVTAGAFDLTYNGDYDGFVLCLSPSLDTIYRSTCIGGSGADFLYALALYGEYNPEVYVAGYTSSTDFPVSDGAYRSVLSGPTDIFVTRFDNSLSNLIASTYLGGSSDDRCRALAVDAYGNPYIAGWSNSNVYPVTGFTYDTTYNGGWDAVVTKLASRMKALLASTFLGGTADDLASALTLDPQGNVYVTGYTQSSKFPVPEGTYDNTLNGTDVFVARFSAVNNYRLAVTLSGTGSGSVSTSDGGIDCGQDCSEFYDEGFIVTLTATPDEGSVFGGWSGDIFSPDNPIRFQMNSDVAVTARFVPAEDVYTLTVVKAGPGNGKVTSEDEKIDCGEVCSVSYPAGTLVTLTATPDEFSGFDSWAGDISGTGKTISFLMDGDKTVVAVFGPYPLPDLTGEWVGLKYSRFLGSTVLLSGFFKLINDGDGDLKGDYKISYYLSPDGQAPGTLIETRGLGYALAPDGTRILAVAFYLSQNVNPLGKYLMAVLDPENQVEEKNEDNNVIVFGPIGQSSGSDTGSGEQKVQVKRLAENIKNKLGK